jgi:hypothetical protein
MGLIAATAILAAVVFLCISKFGTIQSFYSSLWINKPTLPKPTKPPPELTLTQPDDPVIAISSPKNHENGRDDGPNSRLQSQESANSNISTSPPSLSIPMGPPSRPIRISKPPRSIEQNDSTSSLMPKRLQSQASLLRLPPQTIAAPMKPSRQVVLTPGHSPLDWARLQRSGENLRGVPMGQFLRVNSVMLKQHRRKDAAWTVLGGKVYNITPYLPFHPGGEAELMRAAGRDGTQLFQEYHSWINWDNMLSQCLVGIYVEE